MIPAFPTSQSNIQMEYADLHEILNNVVAACKRPDCGFRILHLQFGQFSLLHTFCVSLLPPARWFELGEARSERDDAS